MIRHANPLRTLLLLLSVAAVVTPAGTWTSAGHVRQGPREAAVIVDSQMTEQEAFDGLDPACPAEIRNRQKIVEVTYYSDDGKLHRGQLVVDGELEQDIKKIFEVALRERTPIHSVIPASHPRFRRNGRWDDNLTMESNNTSAFNYRPKTGGGSLSVHAYGRAIDINPLINPYIVVRNRRRTVQPRGARYDLRVPGTFTAKPHRARVHRAGLGVGRQLDQPQGLSALREAPQMRVAAPTPRIRSRCQHDLFTARLGPRVEPWSC